MWLYFMVTFLLTNHNAWAAKTSPGEKVIWECVAVDGRNRDQGVLV